MYAKLERFITNRGLFAKLGGRDVYSMLRLEERHGRELERENTEVRPPLAGCADSPTGLLRLPPLQLRRRLLLLGDDNAAEEAARAADYRRHSKRRLLRLAPSSLGDGISAQSVRRRA